MADERISSVVAPSAFDEVKRLGDDIVALEKKANSIDIKIGDTNSIRQMSAELKELFSTTNQVQQAVKAQEAARKANNQVEKDSIALQKQLEATGKANMKMLLDLEKAKKREHKLNQEASSDYKILSKAYQDATLRAKDYNLQLGAQHPITVQATADALAMANRLKEVDASVGQFQRNVGNYNMVGAQFNQLLREAPNFAISWRTGIMSMTNNVTYFFEAVKVARAEGQSWMQVLKTVGGSMFGLVGILNIAITAITYFSLNSEKAAEKTKTLTETIDDLTESTIKYIKAANDQNQLINDAFNQGSRAQQRYIDLLTSQGATEEVLGKEREKLHKLRISEAKEQIQSYDAVETAVTKYAKSIKEGGRGQVQAQQELNKLLIDNVGLSEEQAKAEADKIKNVAEEMRDNGKAISLNSFKFLQGIMDERIQLEEKVKDELNAIETNKYDTAQAIRDRDEKNHKEYLKKKEKESKESIKRQQEYEKNVGIEPIMTSSAISFVNQTEAFKESANEIEIAGLNLLTRIEEQYATGVINAEEYEQAKVNAAHTANREKLRIELGYTKSVADLIYNPEERTKALQRINEIELEIIRIGNAEKLAEYQKDVKAREEAEREANKKIAEQRKQLQFILQQIQTTITALAGIQSDKLQARITQLQKEGQLIEANGKREIEKIQRSGLSQEEQQKAIREQEAKTESQRIANEARQREAARRKAAFDKAANISNIITTGALAVVNAYYENGPIGAAIAGVAVAAQLARAASAPLPQYAGGTADHVGGPFVAGEKESELVIRPDGRAYWTKDTATVYDEPKHTKVFNQEQINRIAMASLNPAMIAALKPRRDEDFTKHIVNAVEKTGRNTVRAIAQNRANVNVSQQSVDLHYLSKVKGRA